MDPASLSTNTAPPPHLTISTFAHGPISLPLVKLSYCITATPRSNMRWTHLPNRDGMFAVFDLVRRKSMDGSIAEKKVLKLTNAGDIVEEVEFDVLRHQVHMDDERGRARPLRDDDRCVIILVKNPLLALRFQLSDGQIRKIQMNFQPASGCEIALNTFKSIGIPIRDKSQVVQPEAVPLRPQSSQLAYASFTKPQLQGQIGTCVTAYDQMPSAQPSQMQSRPTSAISSSTETHSQEQVGILGVSYAYAPPSTQPSPVHYEFNYARPSSHPPSQDQLAAHNITVHDLAHSTQLSRQIRPSSASNSVNQDEFSRSIAFAPDPRPQLERSSSAHVTGYSNAPRPGSFSAIFEPRSHAVAIPSIPSRLLPSPEIGRQSSDCAYGPRPTSAPQTQAERLLTDNMRLSQMLPPKRDLPFPEEKEKPPNANDKAETADLAENELASSKKATSTTTKQNKRRASIVNSKAPKRKNRLPTPEASSSAPRARTKKVEQTRKSVKKLPSSSAPPKISSPPRDNTRYASPISDSLDLPSSQSLLSIPKARSLTVTKDVEINKCEVDPPDRPSSPTTQNRGPLDSVSSNLRPAELLDSLDGWIRKYNNLPSPPKPPQSAKEHLAEYGKYSEEDRRKVIDNLICECLQDEDFGKLVEDLDGAWRRIGLGF